jgi:hypothetical protein
MNERLHVNQEVKPTDTTFPLPARAPHELSGCHTDAFPYHSPCPFVVDTWALTTFQPTSGKRTQV